jgi:hypothetical protein
MEEKETLFLLQRATEMGTQSLSKIQHDFEEWMFLPGQSRDLYSLTVQKLYQPLGPLHHFFLQVLVADLDCATTLKEQPKPKTLVHLTESTGNLRFHISLDSYFLTNVTGNMFKADVLTKSSNASPVHPVLNMIQSFVNIVSVDARLYLNEFVPRLLEGCKSLREGDPLGPICDKLLSKYFALSLDFRLNTSSVEQLQTCVTSVLDMLNTGERNVRHLSGVNRRITGLF